MCGRGQNSTADFHYYSLAEPLRLGAVFRSIPAFDILGLRFGRNSWSKFNVAREDP